MEALTGKQQAVLDYIERRLAGSDPPSQREIAAHFGLSQNAAYQLVSYLRQKGYVVNAGGHRGLRLTKTYERARLRRGGKTSVLGLEEQEAGLPVVGRVAAGSPILAQENIERYLDPAEMFGPNRNRFCLRVVGDSMVDEGIMDGDFVVVEPTTELGQNQMAVVLVGDEATVKRVRFEDDQVVLVPANRARRYRPRTYRRDDETLRIVGKVVGCMRQIER